MNTEPQHYNVLMIIKMASIYLGLTMGWVSC